LVYDKSDGTYICSGTLLNDNINSATPYVLTANHCISDQTVASTLYTEFKYRSQTCNNATTGTYFSTVTDGATLLYTAYATDTTLMRLYGTPSTNVLYAGWDSTTAPATTTAVHNIHHPHGDQQRLSRGSVTGYSVRNPTVTTSFPGSNITNGTILNVTLTTGWTQPGSSGSGLFKGADTNPQVIGQLFGGTLAVCGVNASNVYGRFDVAYNAGMSDWLTQGVKTVTQLYNAATGVHYYAYGVTDSSTFSASNPAYNNQGASFKVSSYQTAGLSPVYRFFNTSNGTYFYTISEKERAAVATNTLRMRYDGIVWYANATPAAGTVPLYSAFNKTTGSQYFTTSSAARSSLIAANPQFITDGIAFHVTP
jgi:lysyl endopeptidase